MSDWVPLIIGSNVEILLLDWQYNKWIDNFNLELWQSTFLLFKDATYVWKNNQTVFWISSKISLHLGGEGRGDVAVGCEWKIKPRQVWRRLGWKNSKMPRYPFCDKDFEESKSWRQDHFSRFLFWAFLYGAEEAAAVSGWFWVGGLDVIWETNARREPSFICRSYKRVYLRNRRPTRGFE